MWVNKPDELKEKPMKLSSVLEYSNLPYNLEKECHLMIKLAAPSFEIQKRKPVNIIAVVDTSTSMNEGGKMDFTKKSLLKMVDNLQTGDKLGVITFDTIIETVLPLTTISDDKKESLRTSIGKLYPRNSTDLYGAILEAYKMAAQVDGDVRIILLTDGEPTVGITNENQIIELASPLLKKTSSHNLSCFGYGDRHNSSLLTSLSDLGAGNYSFINGPDAALVAFGRELGGLLSRYGSDLQIKIQPVDGMKIVSVRSDLDVIQDGEVPTVKISDIYGEETKKVLLKVKLTARDKFLPRAVSLGKVDVTFKKFDNTTVTETLNMLYEFAKSGTGTADDEVLQQIDLMNLLDAQKEAEKAAKSGQFGVARGIMSNVMFTSSNAGAYGGYATTAANTSYMNAQTYGATAHQNSAGMSTLRRARAGGTSASIHGMSMADLSGGQAETSAVQNMVSNFVDQRQQGGGGSPGASSGIGAQGGGLGADGSGGVGGTSGAQGAIATNSILIQNGVNDAITFSNGIPQSDVTVAKQDSTQTGPLTKNSSHNTGGW